MTKPKVPITAAAINFPVMFTPPGGKETVYVMSLVDPSKNIFTGLKVGDKTPYNFKSSDMVIILDDVPGFPAPVLGPILLALPV
jgi:hypothetical protein